MNRATRAYIERLEAEKQNAENAMIKNAGDVQQYAIDFLNDWITENLPTERGRIVADRETTKLLNKFPAELMKAMTEMTEYKGSVSRYIKTLNNVADIMQEFQRNQGIDVKRGQLKAAQELVVAEIVERYLGNGLNANFVQPLRNLLFQNIVGGMSTKQAIQSLTNYIDAGNNNGGKLNRYIIQTAQQATDSYTGIINKKLIDTFDYDTILMTGSLIETSSPQCKHVIKELDGFITRENWQEVKEIADDNGLIEGTKFENLPFNKLHWGCRHEFTPIIDFENE